MKFLPQHDFLDDLKQSKQAMDWPLWETIYRGWFGHGVTLVGHEGFGDHQRQGVDRSIILPESGQIRVEEKIDWFTTNNMFLEYVSAKETGQPGWIEKPMVCDGLVYVYPRKGEAYWFDWRMLQKAWFAQRQQWLSMYKTCEVVSQQQGRTWTTMGIAVPLAEVYGAYRQQHRQRFEKISPVS